MNLLLLFESDRIDGDVFRVRDHRAKHMQDVLRTEVGQTVKVGLLNGPRGVARVLEVADGITLEAALDPADGPVGGDIELWLGMPRPRSLDKLLPEVVAMGLARLVLMETARVEKAFFGASKLRNQAYRALLHEGLMQGKATVEPEVRVERKLWRLLKAAPTEYTDHHRLIAHPEAATPLAHVRLDPERPVLLAVGPEGGFVPPEMEKFEAAGFTAVSMGERPLRVETACVALFAQIELLRAQGAARGPTAS